MRLIRYPDKESWTTILKRPLQDNSSLDSSVKIILKKVKDEGDRALIEYGAKFDNCFTDSLELTEREIGEAEILLDPDLKKSINIARENIYSYHKNQIEEIRETETSQGVLCWRENRPIEKVGLYIPGGSAPLFSSVLMLAIPAKIAGCSEIIMCSPPGPEGKIDPAIIYTASLCGVTKIFMTGGAQAIAAMAYGTESIPAVYKIFGPGNQYVTRAKELVQLDGVAIDMPAGPSEVLVIADETARPEFVAADLLSQAEHGPDSQVILLSDSADLIEETIRAIDRQLAVLPRKDIASEALASSFAILLDNINSCIALSNLYAPEHLILAISSYRDKLKLINSAGSVFLGSFSCESAGDYASGTNHTLPTNGYARAFSGVSADSFVKKISFQELSKEGLKNLGPHIQNMARAEKLEAHRNAVSIRLKYIENETY